MTEYEKWFTRGSGERQMEEEARYTAFKARMEAEWEEQKKTFRAEYERQLSILSAQQETE